MNKTKSFTRGGQIAFHNVRMLMQINKAVGMLSLLFLLLSTLLITYLIMPRAIMIAGYYWSYSKVFSWLSWLGLKGSSFSVPYHGVLYRETPHSLLSQWQFVKAAQLAGHYLLMGLVIAFVMTIVVYFFMVRFLTKRGDKQTTNQFVRGMRLGKAEAVAAQIKKDKKDSDIHLDSFPLIVNSEVQHQLVHGTTGVGKGQAIMKELDCIRQRGDRVIIYDKGCTFTPLYYREQHDVILNPFDARCANWNLWQEALEGPDFENMAESLIPMHGENDPFWVNAARTIFASVAYTMQDDADRSITKLLRMLLTSELKSLETYLSGTEANTLVSEKIEKTAISIRSVLTTYLKSLKYCQGLDTKDKPAFSIRDWIQDETNNNWLFISADAEQITALRPLISMWLAMASITLLSLPENYERRIWFVVDELPSLHKLPQLAETIAEVRKFGGCFLLGMQSFSQLEKVYGRNGAKEIFDLLNTRLFFRSPSADMAKLVSQELGEQEVEDVRENYSYGANRVRDGISIGHQRTVRPIVSYSELMRLEDLHCYLRLPSHYPVVPLTLEREERPLLAPRLMKRTLHNDALIEAAIQQSEGKAKKEFSANKVNADNLGTTNENSVIETTKKNPKKQDLSVDELFGG